MRHAAVAIALAGAPLLSCAGAVPGVGAPPPPGQIELEVWSGFTRPQEGSPVPRRRLVVLLDATRSMERPAPPGGTAFETAQERAAERLGGVPPEDEWSVHVLGQREGSVCAVPERVAGPADGDWRGDAVRAVRAVRPAGEGSVATALREVQAELDAAGVTSRTRILVFSDLDPSCGGDLCAAARGLVEAGGSLEVVPSGDAALPACLAELKPAAAPSWVSALAAPPHPRFRVVEGEGDVAQILGEGEAGGGPVAAPAGVVALDVEVHPPERIGPFRLAPGERVRVRLLDFPGASPPQRAWQVDRAGEEFERLPGIGVGEREGEEEER